jgi:Skp family chaperone for outer membrane proteins
MKKVLVACAAFALSLLFSNNTQAQTKIGYFNEEDVLSLYPNIQQKMDTVLNKYIIDSLKPDYDYALSEMMRLDSSYKADSAKITPSQRTAMQKDLLRNRSTIVNWQQYQNQMVQQKQNLFLKPYMDKILAAFQEVVTEQKYTHVLNKSAIIIAPPADDLSIRIAMKLKLLSKEQEENAKAQLGIGGGAPTKLGGAVPKKN